MENLGELLNGIVAEVKAEALAVEVQAAEVVAEIKAEVSEAVSEVKAEIATVEEEVVAEVEKVYAEMQHPASPDPTQGPPWM